MISLLVQRTSKIERAAARTIRNAIYQRRLDNAIDSYCNDEKPLSWLAAHYDVSRRDLEAATCPKCHRRR